MNTLLETTVSELETAFLTAEEAQLSPSVTEFRVETLTDTAPEQPLTDAERQRWIWLFEQLKNSDIGMDFAQKVKAFCEASTPEEVETLIYTRLEERTIIPLAA